MQVRNGIIIDGVLHELRESKSKDCKQCSLLHLCENEFEPSCICWVGLQSESIKETPMFINRVKLIVRKMSSWGDCRRCFFGKITYGGPKCTAHERKDKNFVYFEKVEE